MKRNHACCILLASLLLVAPAYAQGKVWIVSKSGCPNVDFTEIQPAIDAAAEGDTILVRGSYLNPQGEYSTFKIDGKSLSIVADGLAPVTIALGSIYDLCEIKNLGPAQSVLIKGANNLRFRYPISLADNEGQVWIEEIWAEDFYSFLFIPTVSISNCSSVAIHRSGIQFPKSIVASLGMTDSTVMLLNSTVLGLDATYAVCLPGYTYFPSPGGEAIAINASPGKSSYLFLSGSRVEGGDGGGGGYCATLGICMNSQDGGDAIVTASPQCVVLNQASTVQGGAGGLVSPYMSPCSPPGLPGSALAGPGMILPLPGAARDVKSSLPAVEKQSASIQASGLPGDRVLLASSLASTFLPMLPLNGILLVQPPVSIIPLGTIPSSGQLTLSVPIPAGLVGPGQSSPLWVQGVFVGAAGQVQLASGFTWNVFDETYDPKDGCP